MSPERPLTQNVDPSTMVTGPPEATAGSSSLSRGSSVVTGTTSTELS